MSAMEDERRSSLAIANAIYGSRYAGPEGMGVSASA